MNGSVSNSTVDQNEQLAPYLQKGNWTNNTVNFDNQFKQSAQSIIQDNWPLAGQLRELMKSEDSQGRSIGAHTIAVIASINDLIDLNFTPEQLFLPSREVEFNNETSELTREAIKCCWGRRGIQKQLQLKQYRILEMVRVRTLQNLFLELQLLYHDIGKLLSVDHHVSRGVHLIRDTNESDRSSVERLFDSLWDRRCFWALLGHHDIFGCLCTGEAAYSALIDMIGWTSSPDANLFFRKKYSCPNIILELVKYC